MPEEKYYLSAVYSKTTAYLNVCTASKHKTDEEKEASAKLHDDKLTESAVALTAVSGISLVSGQGKLLRLRNAHG